MVNLDLSTFFLFFLDVYRAGSQEKYTKGESLLSEILTNKHCLVSFF